MVQHITVVIPTRNRSSILRTTLDALARVRRGSLSVEFLVVDNGSVDDTAKVVRELSSGLPIRALWSSTAGKSHALNSALAYANLGDVVVFTDDDVTPDEDWLEAIIDVCWRWPNHSVFGGRVQPTWPDRQLPPPWAHDDFVQSFAFARHVIGDVECEYPKHITPFGPNFWVRRKAIAGMKFANGLGPHPVRRKLGGETEFLLRLRKKGFEPIYSPNVRVEHRIESARISKMALYRRAFQLGAGSVYTRLPPAAGPAERSRTAWRIKQAGKIAKRLALLPMVAASFDENDRVLKIVHQVRMLGREVETLRYRSEIASAESQ
jgi:glycosyltransferase involved in cell wall biosynthesis